MGICGQKNKDQNLELIIKEKRVPEINQKKDVENNYKKVPQTNPKLVQGTNIKIFTEQKEDQNKIIKDQENKIQPPENKKNNSQENKLLEDHPPVPLSLINEVRKAVCKVKIKYKIGTGFFMKVNDSKKYLVSNYHIISPDMSNEDILLHLSNEKDIKLNLKNRHIDYFQEIDITLIEIKDIDKICKEIKFLTYDLNYILGYEVYKNGYVFTIGYPRGEESYGTGKIVDIKDQEFYHTIQTDFGSGGSPIMLLNNNINEIRVVGIHAGLRSGKYLKIGTFIAEILGEEKEEFINPEKIKKDECLIQFISGDQHVNMLIICKVTDKFSVLEEKLYKDFPDLRNKNIIFLAKGNIINRSATLEENKIKNDTTIQIHEMSNDS